MATPTVSKTRSMLEGLVREGSFKWLLGKRSSFNEELEEMERSPSAGRNCIAELSPLANLVVRRCSKYVALLFLCSMLLLSTYCNFCANYDSFDIRTFCMDYLVG
jgi:hypothetical protein